MYKIIFSTRETAGNMSQMDRKISMKDYILLYTGIFIFSLCSIAGNMASFYPFFSFQFLFFYSLDLMILAMYALFWQQILKRFPLTTAYSNRPLATVLGMMWAILFFKETITIQMMIGAIIILYGIRIVVKADEI